MMEKLVQRLAEIMIQVQSRSGKNFSGIGIIVCDAAENLPLFPIRLSSNTTDNNSLVERLVSISSPDSEFHDGFHVISSDFKLGLVAQYFSPPINDQVRVDRSKRFGGRYLAALFGSSLPTVSATAIASNGFGIAIFQQGIEIYFKPIK